MKTNVLKQYQRKPPSGNGPFRLVDHTNDEKEYFYERESDMGDLEEFVFFLHYALVQNLYVEFEVEVEIDCEMKRVVDIVASVDLLNKRVELGNGAWIAFDDVLRARILYH